MKIGMGHVCATGWLLAVDLFGQTLVDLGRQSKNIDFSTASSTKPAKTGTSLPTTCAVGEVFFDTTLSQGTNLYTCGTANAWSGVGRTGQRIPVATLATLPSTCSVGDLAYVTDASFSNGSWGLYSCSSLNTWSQAGLQADGTGYLIVTCAEPSNCLVGPNTAVLPSLPGSNVWTGASDFSGASKTAMFRLAASPPATCDATAREAYFDTTANTISICTSVNTWTALPSLRGTNVWTGVIDFSHASKTAMFRLAASPPATCDATAHETYFDTTANVVSICSSANTWTPVGGRSGSFLLYQNTKVAALTANGSDQLLDSFVIPAGKLRVGDLVEIEANFTRTGSAGPITFSVWLGSDTTPFLTTPTSSSTTNYRATLVVADTASEIWGGSVVINGVAASTVSSPSGASADIGSPIAMSLKQNGMGPDMGAVSSWFVKVTR